MVTLSDIIKDEILKDRILKDGILKDGILVDNQDYQINGDNKQSYWQNKTKKGESIKLKKITKKDAFGILEFLKQISRIDLKKIRKDNPFALVLFNNKEYEHNTDDRLINVTDTNAWNFTLKTGNVIGFVTEGKDKYSLKISSRFGELFLRYLIADADGFLELKDIGSVNDEDNFEKLLAYHWNIQFKRAYRRGLPKAYKTKNERTSRVRGTIDVIDYFQNKVPGKYLCSYREHSYDNPATSLFIKAYQAIKHYSFCQDTRSIYNALLVANQGVKRTRQEILSTQHFTNPFYNDYNVLIDLSKKIIRQQSASIDLQDESSAYLFDVSMLFEYFIWKLIKREGDLPLRNKNEKPYKKIPVGDIDKSKRKLIPDIVFEYDNGLYVFDVKYKTFDFNEGVKRADLFQLHTYIGQYGNEKLSNGDKKPFRGCGFIYPISEDKWNNQYKEHALISDEIEQQGRKIPFHVLFLKIPDEPPKNADNKKTFNELMKEQCDIFMDTFKSEILIKQEATNSEILTKQEDPAA